MVGENDPLYAVENITNTVYVTAHDIRYWTGREAGSGYDLGAIPETWQDMVRLFPAAVNVVTFQTLPLGSFKSIDADAGLGKSGFTPYCFIILFIKTVLKILEIISAEPYLVFGLFFTLGFAFAVGISTWNFGTLVRYKLPLMPIFGSMLAIFIPENKASKYQHVDLNKIVIDASKSKLSLNLKKL